MRTRKIISNRKRNLPHLAGRLFGVPLLVDDRKLANIIPAFQGILEGKPPENLDDDDYRDSGEPALDQVTGIAVIRVIGSLVRRKTWLDVWSGLTSYADIGDALDCALSDARCKAVLLQVDSFGGEAAGCFELCQKIFAARSVKPIWAVADIDALSAGYAILSSAERCFVNARGSCGSVGVVAVHMERSIQNEMMGLTYTVFRAGDRKAELNSYEKLTPQAAAKLSTSLERTRMDFANLVSQNRGISVDDILATEGQWYDPPDGIGLSLVDGVSTYEDVFVELNSFLVSPPAPPPPEPEPPEPPEDPPAPIEPPDDDEGDPSTEECTMDPTKPNSPPAPAPEQPATPAASASDPKEIASLCKMAGFPAMAADLIESGATVAQAREQLTNARAAADRQSGEISTHNAALASVGMGNVNLGGLGAGARKGMTADEASGWEKGAASARAHWPASARS